MKTKAYNLVQAPFLSFFSKRMYSDVGRNWRGANLAYLFLVLAICCIPPTLSLRRQMIEILDNEQTHIINQIPDIHIANGRASMDQHFPFTVTWEDGSPAIIIDTTGSKNFIENKHVVALLTDESLIVRLGSNYFHTFSLEKVSDLQINEVVVKSWMQTARASIAPVCYSFFLITSFIVGTLGSLIASLAGLIVSKSIRMLGFAGAFRIAALAATPSIVFISISSVLKFPIYTLGLPVFGGLHLAIYLIYFVAGLSACAKSPNEDNLKLDLKSLLHEDAPTQTKKAA